MSDLTQCPTCSALFRVVADQLKVSNGWVRCGQCGEAFEARKHFAKALLEQERLDAMLPSALSPHLPHADAVPDVSVPVGTVNPSSQAATHARGADNARFRHSSGGVTASQLPDLDAPELQALTPDEHWAAAPSASPPSEYLLSEPPDARPINDAPMPPPTFGSVSAASAPDVAFLREARNRAFWTSGWVRMGLLFTAALLVATMALQVVLFERDRIAAHEPQTTPWLQSACELFGCKVGPLRHLDAVAIDASSFNKVKPDHYRLRLTLKNTMAVPVAVPAVELTLNDAQDQPVARRVLLPAEMGAQQVNITRSGEFSASVVVQVLSRELNGKVVAGYRVVAFYP